MPLILSAWIGNLRATLVAGSIVALAWGTGRWLLGGFRLRDTAFWERLVLAVGLGFGAVYVAVFLLGLAGLASSPACHVLAALLAIPTVFSMRKELAAVVPHRRLPVGTPIASALFAAAALTALAAWLAALSPPVFFDALVYHLGLPNLYLRRGVIEALPTVYASFPPAGEMLYLLGMGLGGIQAASLLNLAAGILAAVAVGALAGRHWGHAVGLAAGSIFYLAPPLFLLSRYATGENLLSLFTLLVYLCLFRRIDGGSVSWLLLGGTFGGLAFSVKHVGIIYAILLPAAALALVAATSGKRGWPVPGGGVGRWDALLLTVTTVPVALPWLARNWAVTGNPVFPAVNALFGGRGWTGAQAALLARDAHAATDMIRSWKDALRLPFDLVASSHDFGAASQSLWFWPLVLAGASVLLLSASGRKERLLLGLVAGSMLLWSVTFLMARFLLPAMALGAIVAAVALERVPALRHRAPCWLLTGLLLASNTVFLYRDGPTRHAFPPALGLQTRADYLRSMLRAWPAFEVVNRDLPPASRVLVLGESRTAWIERDHLASSALDPPLLPAILRGGQDPARFAAALRDRGITHVLVNVAELRRLERDYPVTAMAPALRDAFLRFLDTDCRHLYAGSGVHLFELPAE